MIDLGGLAGLKEMWVLYAMIIFTVYIVVRGWNVYNKMVYGKKNRRRTMPPTTDKNLEDFFKLQPSTVSTLQQMKEVSIDFGDNYKIGISGGPKGPFEGKFCPT
jgi:poly-beta-1,6-N-acetyl-D-glucosamine biosynthesis protein PgaD